VTPASTVDTGSVNPAHRAAPPPRLHQPWRGLVALAELLVAAAAVVFAVWCWRHGIAQIVTPVPGQPPLVSTVFYGDWMAIAIGLVVLAGFLVLDGMRQTALAVRARPKKAKSPAAEFDPESDPESDPDGQL
jgi:hypothetical protein